MGPRARMAANRARRRPDVALLCGLYDVWNFGADDPWIPDHGQFHGGVNHFVENFDPGRFSATVLLVTMIFAVFFAGRAISESLGEGGLYALFFQRPSHRAKA